ncbi:hypothetical protein [Rhizobium tubonense]|nr:hypothetical protein [Rhizobium tubonense]
MPKFAAMALSTFFLSLASGTLAASAADVVAPVKEVMDATAANWAGGDSEWQDLFGPDKLNHLYSKDFIAKYEAASKFPAVDDDGISPFDYDVIVQGQDACPLEDVTIKPGTPANGKTEVIAQFKKQTCMGTDAANQAFSVVRFEVLEEDGKPVIDDILTVDENGKDSSLKETMDSIVKQQ